MEVILDCALLRQKESAHEYLKGQFAFPDWYGKNLDALYDCLTQLPPCRIQLRNPAALHREGSCCGAILEVLQDAARDNPNLELIICSQVEE